MGQVDGDCEDIPCPEVGYGGIKPTSPKKAFSSILPPTDNTNRKKSKIRSVGLAGDW